jgi:hypothetical protein
MRIVSTFMLALLGCASAAQYGSFVQDKPQAQAAIGTDAAAKLAIDYPPESHTIRIAQEAQDAFGRGFASALRERGYAVQTSSAATSAGELPVRYTVDKIKSTELLRLTLYVQRRLLSRAYAQRSDGVYPAGPWSVGELPVGEL